MDKRYSVLFFNKKKVIVGEQLWYQRDKIFWGDNSNSASHHAVVMPRVFHAFSVT